MEVSIVLSQILRAQESAEALLGEEADGSQISQIAEALDALRVAEACIYNVLTQRSEGLGQRLAPPSHTLQSRVVSRV